MTFIHTFTYVSVGMKTWYKYRRIKSELLRYLLPPTPIVISSVSSIRIDVVVAYSTSITERGSQQQQQLMIGCDKWQVTSRSSPPTCWCYYRRWEQNSLYSSDALLINKWCPVSYTVLESAELHYTIIVGRRRITVVHLSVAATPTTTTTTLICMQTR